MSQVRVLRRPTETPASHLSECPRDRGEHRATIPTLATDKQVAARGVVRVVGVEPIFAVTDVARSVAHYERLGFTTSHHDATYAFAHRDRLDRKSTRLNSSHVEIS